MPPKTIDSLAAAAQEIARLKAENETLKKANDRALTLRVSEKGAISVYGMGRFPMTAYAEQWEKILAMRDAITGFIEVNRKNGKLVSKAERQAREASAPSLKPGVPQSAL